MRGVSFWSVVLGVAVLVGCFVYTTTQRQFQQQLADLREEMHRRPAWTEVEPPPGPSPVMQISDPNALRTLLLDDIRTQLAAEESEEESARLVRKWLD